VSLDKATIELIRERTRADAEAAEAAEAAAQADRSQKKGVAAAWGRLTRGRTRNSGERAPPAAPVAAPEFEVTAGAEVRRKPKSSAQLIHERLRDSGEGAEAAAFPSHVEGAAGGGLKPKSGAQLIRERLSNSGERAPVERSRNKVVAAAWGGLTRAAKAGAQLIGGLVSYCAAPGRRERIGAAAATITILALAVFAAVRFDPWAGEGCPTAADRGADCSRYGVAGRTFSELALMNVDRELDKSQWASAKYDLQPILLIRPNFAVALSARGEAETGLRDTTAALADFDRALKLAPNDLATRAKRGQLYQSLGKTSQAVADFSFIYSADQSTPHWAGVVEFVRRIDHSTAPPKVHKHPKRRHEPSADAGPPPEQSPQAEPSEGT